MKFYYLFFTWILFSCSDSQKEIKEEKEMNTKEVVYTPPENLMEQFYSLIDTISSDSMEILQFKAYIKSQEPIIREIDSVQYIVRNRGNLKLKACIKGTQNQTEVYFRNDKTFDYISSGIFFSFSYRFGTFKEHGDTLVLNYNSEEKGFAKFVRTKSEELIPINHKDSVYNTYRFYIGDCRGEN